MQENKTIPQNLKLEQSVIGLIIQEPKQYDQVATILNESCFLDGFCKSLYKAVVHCDQKNMEFDSLIITQHVAEKTGDKLSQVFLKFSEVEQSITSYSNIASHALILKELSLRREIYLNLGKLAQRALDESIDVFETINNISQALGGIEGGIQNRQMRSIGDIMPETIEEIETAGASETGLAGLPTMIHAIDKPLSGLKEGKLIVIGARPAMGKTALCLSMMLNLSTYQSIPSLFISLEMPETEIVKRFICNHCDIDNEVIKSGRLGDAEYNALHENLQPLIGSDIFIDDQAGVNMVQIKSKIRQAVNKNGVKVVFIDYLQLIKMEGSNRDQAIGEVTRALKEIAKEYKITIILLCQLSRSCESRSDKRPMLSDLRESGNIEQDADAVAFLYRDAYYNDQPTDNAGETVPVSYTELIWGKNRDGSTGYQEMNFIGSKFRFENYS